ncbi:TIGR01777 family oxidoreductase [Desulfomarina sp.]
MTKTLITGCSGLIGSALVEHLFNSGYSIQCLQRNRNTKNNDFWKTARLQASHKSPFDAVIHLAGENVAQGRWNKAKKEKILQSRVNGTRELVDYISHLPKKPGTFLCASAAGYYGNRGEEIVDERSGPGEGFLAEVCREWEKETERLPAMGVRVVNLRFGMVLSPNGGALHKMIPPFRAGVGGIIGSGEQYISWISIRDICEIVSFILTSPRIQGPVNVVSPVQTTNRELSKTLGKILNKPVIFRIPAFAARMIFGRMADEMLLTSTRAAPTALLEAGYTFQDQSLETVLRFCTRKEP